MIKFDPNIFFLDYFGLNKDEYKTNGVFADFFNFKFESKINKSETIIFFFNSYDPDDVGIDIEIMNTYDRLDESEIFNKDIPKLKEKIKSIDFIFKNNKKNAERYFVNITSEMEKESFNADKYELMTDYDKKAKLNIRFVFNYQINQIIDINSVKTKFKNELFKNYCIDINEKVSKDDVDFLFKYFNKFIHLVSDNKNIFKIEIDENILKYIKFNKFGKIEEYHKELINLSFKL